MEINIESLRSKLEDNAMLVSLLVSAYERFDGDVNAMLSWLTGGSAPGYTWSPGMMHEIKNSLTWKDLLIGKLGFGPRAGEFGGHLYSGLFKVGLATWLLSQIDILGPRYKKIAEQIMWGSGISAAILPGSPGDVKGSGQTHSTGGNPFEGVYG